MKSQNVIVAGNSSTLAIASPIERYASTLLKPRSSYDMRYGWEPLIPREALAEIIQTVERSRQPPSPKEAQAAAGLIIGAYRKTELQDPKVYVAALVREIAEMPASVLPEIVRRVHRNCRFLPSVAEVVEIGEELRGEASLMLSAARRQLHAHEMRTEDGR